MNQMLKVLFLMVFVTMGAVCEEDITKMKRKSSEPDNLNPIIENHEFDAYKNSDDLSDWEENNKRLREVLAVQMEPPPSFTSEEYEYVIQQLDIRDGKVILDPGNFYRKGLAYLSTLEKLKDLKKYEKMKGKWNLSGFPVRKNRFKFFSWERKLEITERDGSLILISPREYQLYIDKDGDIYFQTYWDKILKKVIWKKDKIFLYHLDRDWWILDAQHEGGKYWYAKAAEQ